MTSEERMLVINRLHELLRPFMLRRVKIEVMGQLPEKVRVLVERRRGRITVCHVLCILE